MHVQSGSAAPGTVEAWLDSRKVVGYQIFVAVLCGLAVLLDGIGAQVIGYIVPSIRKSLNLTHEQMGAVISMGLLGLFIGGIVASILADMWGRRMMLIACTVIFGICTVLCGMADTPSQLVLWRFVAGLGFGGAMPIAITLTAEFAPPRARSVFVMVMFCGFPGGGALGGVLASALLAAGMGWQTVFIASGVISLVIALMLILWLPESMVFMVNKGIDGSEIQKVKAKIEPLGEVVTFVKGPAKVSAPVSGLFRDGRAAGTIFLWVIYFISLLEIYFLTSWLPTVLNGDGHSMANAALGTSVLQFGGVAGTLVFGRFMDRLNQHTVLLACYVFGCLLVGSIGYIYQGSLLYPTLFLGGMFLIGAQSGLSALASTFYPTHARATGVGWALSLGRIGSMCGPMIGAILLQRGFDIQGMFMWVAAPMLFAGLCSQTLQFVRPKTTH